MLRYRTAILIVPFLLAIPLASAGASIVFSELLWSGSDLSSADEWIELTNTGSGAVSLSGWTITRKSGGNEVPMLTIPKGKNIGSGGIFVIANFEKDASRLAIGPDLVDTAVSLTNTQLLLKLYDSSGSLVDAADDGVGAPFAGSTSPFASMERIDLSGSGQQKANWRTATTFLNFDDGAAVFGTPGAPNGTGPLVDMIPPKEATNFAAEIRSGSGIVGAFGQTPLQITWVPSVSLDLHSQTLLLSGTGITLLKTATGLLLAGYSTGITVTLRSTDALGNTSTGTTTVSRLFPNVKITEVLANPIGNDDEEWIEVGNLGQESVDIGGWILDEGNSSGDFRIPSPLLLPPDGHRIFRKSVTGLPLQNDGELLTLRRGLTLMDAWSYSETAEEVSFGRTREDPPTFRSFCVPTPNKPNDAVAPVPLITIQGGELTSASSIALNLIAAVQTGSTVHATCNWNYGDGFTSESCNPPSHTFTKVGSYEVRLTYRDFCGNTVETSITVTVLPQPVEGGGSQGGSQKGGGTSGGSSGGESGNRTSCMPTHFDGVRVSEFLADPEGKDEDEEWIEIENTSEENVSLCGWELDDAEGGSKPFHLDTFLMAPKGFLHLPRPVTKIALNNTDDSVRLFKPSRTLLEEITYSKSIQGESFALRSDGLFVWTPFPTPGAENRFREVSAKSPAEGAVLSAVLPNPDGKDEGNEWIEVMNIGKTAVDLKGWQLDNGKKSYTTGGGTLEPHAVRRFGDGVTGITLTNTEGEARLIDPERTIVSLIHWVDAVSGKIYRPSEAGKKVDAFVIAAIDGDTIDVEINGRKERVRMIGVDTPESVHPNKAVQRFGKEASDFTKMMLTKKEVMLEFGDEERDKYGRILAYVLLPGDVNFNGLLIRKGLAYAYLRFPFALSALFSAYEEEARQAKLGLWADEEAAVAILEIKEEENSAIAMTGTGATASGTTLSGSTLVASMSGSVETPPSTGSGQAWAFPQFNPLNEIMSNPPKEGPFHELGEYLELWNPTDDAVTLEGWILDDDLFGSSKPKKLNEKYVIEPHGYLLLCKGEGCDLPLSISLNNEGEEISLTSPDGGTIHSVTYPELERGEAYAFHGNTWCITGAATPSAENICLPRTNIAKKEKSVGALGQAPLQPPSLAQKNPLSVLRIKYRHIYAPEDLPKETPQNPPPLLSTLLSERRPKMQTSATIVSLTILQFSLLGSISCIGIIGIIATRRKVLASA